MLKIWGRADAPNVRKVLWGCEELGLAYQRIDHGGPFGGGDDPAYLAKNPNGLVPTLEDGTFVLWESHAILRYLANGAAGDALYPSELHRRALVDQWLDWQAVHQAAAVRGLVRALAQPGGVPAPALEEAERLFEILEDRLGTSAYLAGESFTLADIAAGVGAARWLTLPIARPDLPALAAWSASLAQRPAFRRMTGEVA